MSAKTNDNLYLAAGGIALLGTCIWAFLQQSDIAAFQNPVPVPSSGSPYEAAPINLAPAESKQWVKAPSQSAGANWLFDVFTPPVIYYNVQTKQFTVTIPELKVIDTSVVVDPVVEPFGLELVKVEQALFRLQLVGYVGEGPSARGNFEDQINHKVIFGTAGKKLPELNLEIVKFSAERRRTKVDGGTEIVETVATALVRDTVTGVETPLDAKVRTTEGSLAVTLKKTDGSLVTAKSGEKITIGENTFTVGELHLSPPSAVVTKEGGKLPEPKTETLLVPPPAPPAAAPTEGLDSSTPHAAKPPGAGFPGF